VALTSSHRPTGPAARLAGAALLSGWFVLPLVPLALWAAADQWRAPSILPQQWGLRGWSAALDEGAFGALLRTTALGLAVAALATPAGALAGRALAHARVPAARTVSVLLLAPVAVPGFALAIGLDVVLLRLRIPPAAGVLLVLSVAALPYTTYTMRVAYGAHDLAYEQEARTLGASPAQVLRRVHLPMLAPALASAGFLAFLVASSDYVVTLIIGGGRYVTLPLLVASSASAVGNEPEVGALSLTALLPPLVLLVLLRRLRRGTS
jgi:putative spermidine/putrescine transport system permease protein